MKRKSGKSICGDSDNVKDAKIEKQPKAKRRRAIILDSDEEENKESKDFINQQNEGEQNKKSRWVQCDNPECQKWRRIDYDADISKLANAEWICDMNEDKNKASCGASQETLVTETEDSDDDGDACYTGHYPGMVLWGKISGYPWWPCLVDYDPDLNDYFWNEPCESTGETRTSIHVTFFGNECTRAWLMTNSLRDLSLDDSVRDMGNMKYRGTNFKNDVIDALQQAKDSLKLSLKDRLARYSFKIRYNGQEYTGNQGSDEDEAETKDNTRSSSSSSEFDEDLLKSESEHDTTHSSKDDDDVDDTKVTKKSKPPKLLTSDGRKKPDRTKSRVPSEIAGLKKNEKRQKKNSNKDLDKEKVILVPKKQKPKSKMSRAPKAMDSESKEIHVHMSGSKGSSSTEAIASRDDQSFVGTTVECKEQEFRRKGENWKLTKEEISSVPCLIKPVIVPVNEKEISEMADKMVKDLTKGKRKAGKKSDKNKESCVEENAQEMMKKTKQNGKVEEVVYAEKNEHSEEKESNYKNNEITDQGNEVTTVDEIRDEDNSRQYEKHNEVISKDQNANDGSKQDRADKARRGSQLKNHKKNSKERKSNLEQEEISSSRKISNKEEIRKFLAGGKAELSAEGKYKGKSNVKTDKGHDSIPSREEKRSNKECIDNVKNKNLGNQSIATDTEKTPNAEISIKKSAKKTKKNGFAVPRKKESIKANDSKDRTDLTVDEKASRKKSAKKDEKMQINGSPFDSSTVDSCKKRKGNSKKKGDNDIVKNVRAQCMKVLVEQTVNMNEIEKDIEHSCKEAGNLLRPSLQKVVNNENHYNTYKHGKRSKTADSYQKSIKRLKEESSKAITCNDAAEQRLEEIISYREANEIIADSLGHLSSKEKSTESMQGSPLIPENITDELPFSNLFKAVPVCEDIPYDGNHMSQNSGDEDQVIPVASSFEDSDNSSEF